MHFGERLSTPVQILYSKGGNRCPEVWRLDNGDYAIIGKDITDEAKINLPEDVEVGDEERVVLVPKLVLESAKPKI